eukprot:4818672-Karenia_brevis.AAC.1
MARMHEEMVPMRRGILDRHQVAPANRAAIATRSLLASGIFQASAWPAMRSRELAVFHSGVMAIFRPIALT